MYWAIASCPLSRNGCVLCRTACDRLPRPSVARSFCVDRLAFAPSRTRSIKPRESDAEVDEVICSMLSPSDVYRRSLKHPCHTEHLLTSGCSRLTSHTKPARSVLVSDLRTARLQSRALCSAYVATARST